MKKVLLILLVIIFGASISAENKSKAEATATDPASTVTSKASISDSLQIRLAEIELETKKLELQESQQFNEETREDLKGVIPIIAIIFGVGIPCAMVVIVFIIIGITSHKRRRMRYQLLEKAIEHNYQLPEKALDDTNEKTPSFKKEINISITLIAAGIAIPAFFAYQHQYDLALLLTLPLILGIGKLIFAIVTKKKGEYPNNNDNA
ncbi:MAG: DUF6249 domain-containing protein [Candidatus Limisoma sp.]|nr:DUF6249 domain-containing protein [Candidatus Limisoma sp.]